MWKACPLLLLLPIACGPTTKDLENAQIHYDLGVSAMENAHDTQAALRELQAAVQANPDLGDAYNALGLVYHLMLHRPEEAVTNYQKALKLDPRNSEAANNLGAALTDLGRYAEAAAMFQRALSNDLYRTPYIAQGNLGWALYKSGDAAGGIGHLKTAVQINPEYCQGYRSLGMIASEQNQLSEAEAEFKAFEKHCPTMCESHYRLAMVLLKRGDQPGARDQLGQCTAGCPSSDLSGECERLLKMMQ
jgi:type IV pilus assembly protein PilF